MKTVYSSNLSQTTNKISCLGLLALFILSCALTPTVHGQIDPDLENSFSEQLNDLAAEYDLVGFSAAVQLPNGQTWTGATGISAEGEPLSTEHTMSIASNTKQFVSATVLKLAADDQLNIDDPISNWINGIEYVDGDITVRQLMNHTSGVYNYSDNPEHIPSITLDLDSIWEPEDVLETLLLEPVASPGEEYNYSNSNYILLRMIIEEITGEMLHNVIREQVLDPLNAESTSHLPYEEPVDPLANIWSPNPYTGEFEDLTALGFSFNSVMSISHAGGAIFSTPSELARLNSAMVNGEVLDSEGQSQMMDFSPANHVDEPDWSDIEYGLGLSKGTIGEETAIGHTGNLLYRSACFTFPEHDLTVSFITNDDTEDLERIVAIEAFMQAYLEWLPDGYLIDSELISTTPANETNYWDDIPDHYDVANYKLTYNTIGVDGMPTTASGLISIPQGTGCEELPMLVNCHGTVLQNLDIPSEMNFSGERTREFASSGFIGVAPDYLGYSDSPGLHPYHHAETEATATIDMMHAAREFMEGGEIQDNGEVFVTGYSQGGHAAMATLEYAEENEMTEELGIVAGAPLSGPYDLSGTIGPAIIFEQVEYSSMAYIAYTLVSYEMVYGNLYDNLDDFFLSPYYESIPDWFDGEQNEYSIGDVNSELPNTLSDLLTDTVVDNMQSNMAHPIWQNLEDNDTYNWTPQIPMRLYYCQADNTVPYLNSTVAETELLANGAEDVEATDVFSSGNHWSCIEPAHVAAYEFFEEIATMCDIDLSVEGQESLSLEVFPNPASSSVTIKTHGKTGHIVVYDKIGKVVLQTNLVGDRMEIDVSSWSPGIYIAEIQSKEGFQTARVVVEN